MRPQFVLFGDSITEQSFRPGGWGAALADQYSCKVSACSDSSVRSVDLKVVKCVEFQADVVLRGYGGYNTRWASFLLDEIFPLQSSKPPLLVTVFFGANDAALVGRTNERQHVPLTEYRENLQHIITHLKECSHSMLIVLITPPPVDENGRSLYARSLYGKNAAELPERTNVIAGTYAKACVAIANESGVPVIDLWSIMQENPGWKETYLSDGLHLTPDGNAVVFEQLLKILSARGLSWVNMQDDFPHHSVIDEKEPHKAFQVKK